MKTKNNILSINILSFVLVVSILLTSLPFHAFGTQNEGVQEAAANKIEKAEVVEEVEELRDKYSKTFLLSDGTYKAVIAADPLYFKTDEENEQWEDIDNTLIFFVFEL